MERGREGHTFSSVCEEAEEKGEGLDSGSGMVGYNLFYQMVGYNLATAISYTIWGDEIGRAHV